MINGVHALLYSTDPDAARALFADIFQLPSVEAGRGWLIFALPPTELAVHPADSPQGTELYLMCDDIAAVVSQLKAKGVDILRPVQDQGWGLVTAIQVPGGKELGLYQPKHAFAHAPPKSTSEAAIDEASDESFPASDPPSWEPLHAGTPRPNVEDGRGDAK
jgi:hypothetical protein